jgi:hypothetical protein
MTISDDNRARFRLIGRDRIALALATGTIQILGINERDKGDATEWVQEQEAISLPRLRPAVGDHPVARPAASAAGELGKKEKPARRSAPPRQRIKCTAGISEQAHVRDPPRGYGSLSP